MVRAHQPIQTDDLNDRLREAGIGVKRPADLVDLRLALKDQGADLRGHEWLVHAPNLFLGFQGDDYGDGITVTVSYIDTRNVT